MSIKILNIWLILGGEFLACWKIRGKFEGNLIMRGHITNTKHP